MGDDIVSYFEACELLGLHCMEFPELARSGVGTFSGFPDLIAYPGIGAIGIQSLSL